MPSLNAEKNWNEYVACAETVSRSPGFLALRDQILERAAIGADDEVLDIGSGTGLLTLPAADRASRVWALDISHRMGDYLSAKAKSAGLTNIEAIEASAVSLPLVDDSVNVVVSNYCFHHLDAEGKATALSEVARVMVPGGRLVIGDMMFTLAIGSRRNRKVVSSKVRGLISKGPGGAWRLAKNGARYASRRWEHPASPEWWRSALRQAGFEAVEVTALEHEGGIAQARKWSSH